MFSFAFTKMSPGFFTRIYRVPHPRLNERWIAAVHLALERAFQLIRADGFDLANAGEDDITFKLEKEFMNRLIPDDSSDLDLGFIANVTRESATANHDESSTGRKPDLVFHLNRSELCRSHNRVNDCLYAECKPVGRAHPLNRHYCAVGKKTSGIERFVSGAYASAMEQAIMIAYVRDGFQITPHLAEALATAEARTGLGEPSQLTCVIASNSPCQGLYLSTHQRSFPWQDGTMATPIDLYHSWHECN